MSQEIILPILDYIHGDCDIPDLKNLKVRYDLILDYHTSVASYIATLPTSEQELIQEIYDYVA